MKTICTNSVALMLALLFSSQFNDAQANCGSGWNQSAVRDSWGGANFVDACVTHDACYETCGASKDSCDKDFRSDMKNECRGTYRRTSETVVRDACLTLVDGYYEAVKRGGSGAFKPAQQQCAFNGSYSIESTFGCPGDSHCNADLSWKTKTPHPVVVLDESDPVKWRITPVPGAANTYTIENTFGCPGDSHCNADLSWKTKTPHPVVVLDESDRVEWRIIKK